MKCAICKQEIAVLSAGPEDEWNDFNGVVEHECCHYGRLPERADLLAYIHNWPMRTGSGLAISIERGEHIGAAKKIKS